MANYSKLRQELHKQQKQDMFKARLRLKQVCQECGHIEIMSPAKSVLNAVLTVLVVAMTIIGGVTTYNFINTHNPATSMMGFEVVSIIDHTKLQQMRDMSISYSDNWDLFLYTNDILARALIENWNNNGTVLTEIGEIKYLHDAVNTQTIYINDSDYNKNRDVLFSPLITMSRGGDCEDRAVLFLTMAEIAGLECYPALTPTHAFAYCLYGEEHERIVFVDAGHDTLGLTSRMTIGAIEMYVPPDVDR